MTDHANKRDGFTFVEALIVLVILAVIGVLGYTFYTRMNDQGEASRNGQPAVADDVRSAPEIQRFSDLDEAADVLDQTDPAASNSDLDQLEDVSSEF